MLFGPNAKNYIFVKRGPKRNTSYCALDITRSHSLIKTRGIVLQAISRRFCVFCCCFKAISHYCLLNIKSCHCVNNLGKR